MKKLFILMLVAALCGCATQGANKVRYCETVKRINALISPGMNIYEAQTVLKANNIRAGEVVSITGKGDDLSIFVRFGFRMSKLDKLSMAMEKDLPGNSDVPIRIVIRAGLDNNVLSIGSDSVECN